MHGTISKVTLCLLFALGIACGSDTGVPQGASSGGSPAAPSPDPTPSPPPAPSPEPPPTLSTDQCADHLKEPWKQILGLIALIDAEAVRDRWHSHVLRLFLTG